MKLTKQVIEYTPGQQVAYLKVEGPGYNRWNDRYLLPVEVIDQIVAAARGLQAARTFDGCTYEDPRMTP